MAELHRGHLGRDGQRDHSARRCTSLMRHFLRTTLAPDVLSGGVMMGPPAGALVMRTGTPERLAPLPLGTLPCAVNIAAIAAATDADRDAATPAAIQPVALFLHPHRTPPQDWTAPCIGGITGVRSCAPTGSAPPKVREFVRRFPGLRCFGVSPQLSENGSARGDREI